MLHLLIALIVAIVVFVVLSSVIVFAHSTLIWGLVAVALFCALAFGARGRVVP